MGYILERYQESGHYEKQVVIGGTFRKKLDGQRAAKCQKDTVGNQSNK